MAENVDNIIIELLTAIRGDLSSQRAAINELTMRISSLEGSVAGLRRDISHLHEDGAMIQVRLDNVDKRVQQIEKKLELTN
jgi:septal ring factor EnvC (AmiA/AmiB activator)